MEDLKVYQASFASVRGMNQLLAESIMQRIPSEREFFELSEVNLRTLTGFSNRIFDTEYRNELLARAKAEVEYTDFAGIERLYYTDGSYPTRLLQADDAPLMLYSLGRANLNDGIFVGIVGTRHATPYGIDFVEKLVTELSEKVSMPVTIVSGLAFGIDIAAHRAALRSGLNTVAVLAHGLNTIYPAAHRNDAAEIVRRGGRLLTEYTSKDPVHKVNFLARNRIVAGICDCLIVVESAEKGGALATARIANDYNRDVFALPGRSSDRYSQGCNRLIARNMASLIQCADDLIEAMQWPVKSAVAQQQTLFQELSDEETRVMNYLETADDVGINRLSVDLNMNIGKLTALLIEMEFKGLIIKFPGGKYRKA